MHPAQSRTAGPGWGAEGVQRRNAHPFAMAFPASVPPPPPPLYRDTHDTQTLTAEAYRLDEFSLEGSDFIPSSLNDGNAIYTIICCVSTSLLPTSFLSFIPNGSE